MCAMKRDSNRGPHDPKSGALTSPPPDASRLPTDLDDGRVALTGGRLSELTYRDGFVCVEVLRPSQPNGVMSSAVSLPNHTFTGQA